MELCRLCLSAANPESAQYIFTPETNIYLKIIACLPVKVSKVDKLPKNICDTCLSKVDDFFSFCRMVIDVENRLHSFENELKPPNLENDSKPGSFECGKNIPGEFPEDISLSGRRSIFKFGKILDHETSISDAKTGAIIEIDNVNTSKISEPVSVETQTEETWRAIVESQISRNIKEENPLKFEFEVPVFKDEKAESDNKDEIFDNEEYLSIISKKVKKSKKHKSLKMKIKRNASNYSVSSDNVSDIEDKISLKKLKERSSKNYNHIHIKTEMPDVKSEYDDLNFDIKHEDDEINGMWACCICFQKCFSKTDMLAHYGSHLIIPQAHCKAEYTENGMLDEKVITCPNCNIIVDSQDGLIKHSLTQCKIKPYKCSLCEKTFKTPSDILKHGQKFHSSLKMETDDFNPIGKRFMCDICDDVFVYMKYLMIHRSIKHPEMQTKSLVHRCMHCRREFSHLNSLRRHLRSHSGEKNFLCNMCGKSLSSREHLKFHIRIHTGFKPNICKTCGKGFVKKCNLTLHERVHSGERPHVCSHCGKAFSQKSTLVIHERYHSGSRPYVCTICNKGFVAKGLLSMHIKTCCV